MFTKKLLPIIAFAAFTAQPIFAADSSDTSATGTSTTGTATTGTGSGASGIGPNSTPASSTTTPASTSTTTGTSSTTSSSASNDNGDTACNCPCKKSMMQISQALQLTDAQKDQIRSIREKAKASIQSSKDQLRSIRSQMHDLITSSSMDNSKLDSLISQKTAVLGKMIRVKVEAKHQMYMVLNPQQQQKFQQMLRDEHQRPNACR
ncbi:Spy/CpxP family protein refolding chaperone [Legionella sp. CNM-1927-20]|uniref:Spy/CpxP family protein refolding chaperone n=1 Tax=Legionella sp. CNM-1927-20 TaxID=3422221 RepID=UPI00403B133C